MLLAPDTERDRRRDAELEDAHALYLIDKEIARTRYAEWRIGDGDGLEAAILKARGDYLERRATIGRYWSRPWRALWSRNVSTLTSLTPQEAVSNGGHT